jgi:predicted nuclease of restriction endonuclease-like (RecB) superfamily
MRNNNLNRITFAKSRTMKEIEITFPNLLDDIRSLISNARIRVASTANIETTLLYWNIGHRINTEVLGNKRADYGGQIVSRLASQLQNEYGNGYHPRNIRRMMQFAEQFPDFQIVTRLASQLRWSHFLEIFPLKDELQREFYLTMATYEGWTRDVLRAKIDGMLFERTAISTKPEETIKTELTALKHDNVLSPDLVFKSPYFLDFTGLRGAYSEKSLEDVLINELECFILELGSGFSFVERQKRMIIDGEDFYLDMLFYHRKLRRLVAIELKLGRFKAAYKGQMELYLNWLNKYERQPGEESPLGLILCSEGSSEQIELLELDKSGIRVAQYYTELPERDLLASQLRKAIEIAKEKGLK